jgi:hypothetical protein
MRRCILLAALLFLLVPAGARAAGKEFEVTVTAGKSDRTNAPVCVPLSMSKDLAKNELAVLHTPDGKVIYGQFTAPGLLTESVKPGDGEVRRDLHFILPALKAGDSLTLKVDAAPDIKRSPITFSWHDTPGEFTELRYGDRPVLRYVDQKFDDSTKEKREATFKVYHHLYDPAGKEIITKGPGGLYTHHRGLFYGFKATYGDKQVTADTWHCPPPSGDPKKPSLEAHLEHEKILSSEAGPVLGRHRVQIGWFGRDKERFATEERELTVYNVPGGQLVEFASKLTPVKGTVKLDGDPQHAGFHFRAVNEVADKTKDQTYFLRPDGKGDMGKERSWDPKTKSGPADLPWDAMSFVVGGKRYTAAYLDRPTNPKEARTSERIYGRFGSYFVAECSDKKPLTVAYRLWLQEGEMTGDGVKALDADFATPPAATVK